MQNPLANAVFKRIHQVVENILKSKDLESYDFNNTDPWSDILTSVAWANRNTVHRPLKATLAELVFKSVMIFHDTFKFN